MDLAAPAASPLVRALGLLLLAAALLLSLPGVRAVRADEPDMTPVGADEYSLFEEKAVVPSMAVPDDEGAAEACDQPAAAQRPLTARAEVAIPRPPSAGPDQEPSGPILLNNRGYNYGTTGSPDAAHRQQLERQLQAAGR